MNLQELLSTKDLCRLFNRTPMTIYLWRMNLGLPFISIPGVEKAPVRFDLEKVSEWAEEKGKEMEEPKSLPSKTIPGLRLTLNSQSF